MNKSVAILQMRRGQNLRKLFEVSDTRRFHDNICFSFQPILFKNLASIMALAFMLISVLTHTGVKKHNCNSKGIPQFDITNYLAPRRSLKSTEIRLQSF